MSRPINREPGRSVASAMAASPLSRSGIGLTCVALLVACSVDDRTVGILPAGERRVCEHELSSCRSQVAQPGAASARPSPDRFFARAKSTLQLSGLCHAYRQANLGNEHALRARRVDLCCGCRLLEGSVSLLRRTLTAMRNRLMSERMTSSPARGALASPHDMAIGAVGAWCASPSTVPVRAAPQSAALSAKSGVWRWLMLVWPSIGESGSNRAVNGVHSVNRAWRVRIRMCMGRLARARSAVLPFRFLRSAPCSLACGSSAACRPVRR